MFLTLRTGLSYYFLKIFSQFLNRWILLHSFSILLKLILNIFGTWSFDFCLLTSFIYFHFLICVSMKILFKLIYFFTLAISNPFFLFQWINFLFLQVNFHSFFLPNLPDLIFFISNRLVLCSIKIIGNKACNWNQI